MDYPGTWLTRRVRIGIMLFLFASFFVAAPTLLLYTAGYRYDIALKTVTKTGVLSIDAQPEDALVSVNGIRVQASLPIRLSNRTPGSYTVSIAKDGYHTWEKTIDIKSKQTTYITDITLYKKDAPTDYTTTPLHSFSGLGRYALGLTPITSSTYTVSVFDTKNNRVLKDFSIESLVPPTVSWSPIVPYAYIQTRTDDRYEFWIIDAHKPDRIYSFNKQSSSTPQFQWSTSPQFPGNFLATDTDITLLRPNQHMSFGSVTSTIWHIDSSLQTITFDETDDTLTIGKQPPVALTDTLTHIISFSDKGMIAQTKDGIAVFSKNGERKTLLPTDHILYDPIREEWITWSSWEIWRIGKELNSVFLTRFGSSISSVFPLEKNGALLVHTDKKLIAFHPEFSTFHELNNETEQVLSVDQTQRMIYLKAMANGSLRQQTLAY